MKNILEVSEVCQMPRFPRAVAVLEILALAELFRTAAAGLEALAEDASRTEPSTLRRSAHGIVRVAIAELQGQVAL